VSESNRVQKYTLLCLRVAAECRNLAEDVATPELSPRGDTNACASFLKERLRLLAVLRQ
jgi:hypothetical protein